MKKYRFPIIIEQDKDGFFASCPALQGCYSQGDTYEEAMKNIREAIRGHVADRLACGEPVSTSTAITFTQLDIAV
ncbi:MAG: type II toxin-antitoxin system HicB family antitoxin [Candidatus Riflebacteria bacterium]|nr:type II toxin-antitoxin system HicB family antitoxin [Candidatus Riflebacteria bacterium]